MAALSVEVELSSLVHLISVELAALAACPSPEWRSQPAALSSARAAEH